MRPERVARAPTRRLGRFNPIGSELSQVNGIPHRLPQILVIERSTREFFWRLIDRVSNQDYRFRIGGLAVALSLFCVARAFPQEALQLPRPQAEPTINLNPQFPLREMPGVGPQNNELTLPIMPSPPAVVTTLKLTSAYLVKVGAVPSLLPRWAATDALARCFGWGIKPEIPVVVSRSWWTYCVTCNVVRELSLHRLGPYGFIGFPDRPPRAAVPSRDPSRLLSPRMSLSSAGRAGRPSSALQVCPCWTERESLQFF